MDFIRKPIFFIVAIIIYSSIAYASAFDVDVVPIDSKIVIDEFATFDLKIKNNLDKKDEYRIYTLDFPTWDVRTDPLVNPITLELEPDEEGSVELIADPLKIRDIGTYQVNVNVRSKFIDKPVRALLKVTILSTSPLIGGYVPTIVTGVGVPEKIDPRQEIPIKISLDNQNIIDYDNLVIKAESNLIKKSTKEKLGPKERRIVNLIARLDPLTYPQEDTLVIDVLTDNRSIISPIVRKLEIVEYTEKKIESEQKEFLLTRSNYKFVSNNNEYQGIFRVETTLLGAILSSTNPKAELIKEDDKRYFIWDVELENNTMHVTVTKNFIPLFVVIVSLIVAVGVYYLVRSPLLMRKECSNIVKKDGGISEITIALNIKNRGKDKLKEIDLTEQIPALVSIGKEVSIGSLQPSKILKHKKRKNTIVKWTIDTLDASEERIISYKIISKLPILGSFSLPAATSSFKSNNKIFTSASNRLIVEN